jgi:hypothetical protein
MKKFSSLLVVLMLMLASFTAGMEYQRGDVDQNGQVNISDVICLINYLMTDTWPEDPVTPPDTHQYVDLGLPSGTLWATCNVGANSPEEYGDLFAWGETEPKEVYDWDTYKWCFEDYFSLTKYCTKSDYGYNGFTDDKTELDPEDDAACVNWGASWRMPTIQQLDELYQECTWTLTQQNGVNGQLVTGPNGNTLFLPAKNGSLNNAEYWGTFWSRTLNSTYPCYAFFFGYHGENFYSWSNGDRKSGVAVRAVHVSQN